MTMVEDQTTLVLKRHFAATPEAVFDAWMVQQAFAAWIGPEGVRCEVPQFEARVGGAYRIDMKMSDGRMAPVAGVFREIERPRRIAFTWGWEGDAGRVSLVTLDIAAAAGGGVDFTLTQEGLGSVEARDDHGRGWSSVFNKLERFLAG
jgi:uncharacterized protein YndB with AHSA1/START domain